MANSKCSNRSIALAMNAPTAAAPTSSITWPVRVSIVTGAPGANSAVQLVPRLTGDDVAVARLQPADLEQLEPLESLTALRLARR